jgi:uncharacterized protein YyaL (SSP411 family)
MPHAADHPGHVNRLAGETSPYLLQHARNPVDWYPWGPEAFERARALDRPVFLSVGYAACHWCHVMERESFEDEETAALLNAHFVAVKVDREERPDIDSLYMGAVQALTGSGGWPMSVFLDPDGRPFFGGTYFPDTPRHGMPSFRQVLEGIRQAWTSQRAGIGEAAGTLVNAIAEQQRPASAAGGLPSPDVLGAAAEALAASFDAVHGGWGRAPKFPQPMAVELLLRRHVATGDARWLALARRSLDAMAAGGIRDQLGGGFHRYSTDERWLVPHFEQMLYDNAQLARVYVHAWQLTGDPSYEAVARGTLDYLLRELRVEGGGFAASQDADTEGVEGATFTWDVLEVDAILGAEAPIFSDAFGVTDAGNWEGRTILSRVRGDIEVAERFGIEREAVTTRLASARRVLLEHRSTRPQPARDDKVLAAWNGLAIAALADAARALAARGTDAASQADAARYLAAAVEAASTVVAGLRSPDGRLRRSWKDGRATADGTLEDYADLAEGVLALYEATFDERWFTVARDLVDRILAHFADPDGAFFDTADDGEVLVVRPRSQQDNATPSGSAMAVTVLLRLAALTGVARYGLAAEQALATVGPYLARYPTAFAQWLCALETAHAGYAEVALVGDPGEPDTDALVHCLDARYRPFTVRALSPDPDASTIPLLPHRFRLGGRATAYVCRDFACRQPVTEPEALEALLAGG